MKFEPTEQWIDLWCSQSELIDPHPNDPIEWTQSALRYGIHAANNDKQCSLLRIHNELTGYDLEAQQYRQDLPLFWDQTPALPQHIGFLLWGWRRAETKILNIIKSNWKSNRIYAVPHLFGLHCELMRIHPFNTHNGTLGRIVMVNQMILLGLEPLVFWGKDRNLYMELIDQHPSSYLTKDIDWLEPLDASLTVSKPRMILPPDPLGRTPPIAPQERETGNLETMDDFFYNPDPI